MEVQITKKMWLAHLTEFSELALIETLEHLPDTFPKWAPTLGEFKQAVRAFKVRPEHQLIPSHLRLEDQSEFDPVGNMHPEAARARQELLDLVHRKTITPRPERMH